MTRTCPRCGAPISAGQRFCAECGTTLDVEVNKPTEAASGEISYPQDTNMATISPTPPPPPPPPELYSPPVQQPPYTAYPPQAPQSYPQSPQVQASQPPPTYAQPQKDSSRSVLGQISCGVLLVILIPLLVCGGLIFAGYYYVSHSISAAQQTATANGSSGNSSNTGSGGPQTGTTPQSTAGVTTVQLNAMVTYASVDITILDAQQANSFTDDANPAQPGLLRLDIREHNPTTGNISYFYSEMTRLILPDGSSVVPNTSQKPYGPDASSTRTNWIDFPVATSVTINKLILRLGQSSEAQMDIPLTGNADLSKYQPKMTSPNKAFQYDVNWTLTTATLSWSSAGKQADKGMRYVTLAFKVDNPTSNSFAPFPSDNMRLKSGSTTSPPSSSTLSTSIAANQTGTTGTVSFLMPEGSTAFTLIMLAQSNANPPISQVTVDFQIQ